MVSVIIPCYNCSATIEETLLSLQRQTWTNFEIICVNDGSTDRTQQVLDAYKESGTVNIKIANKENGGVSSARNLGIELAQGEYIVFIDADDIFHEKYIEQLLKALNEYNTDTAYCRLNRRLDDIDCPESLFVEKQTQDKAMHNLLYRVGDFGFFCYIYRKDILLKNKLRFDENTKFGEDREFIWKYLCHCRTACFVDAPMYGYRITENSATNGKSTWRRADTLAAVRRIEQYMASRHISFLPQVKDYMFARHMWAVAKNFSVGGDRELFQRLAKEYDVKTCMKRTARDRNKLVALASWLYLVHPMLFYHIVRLRK